MSLTTVQLNEFENKARLLGQDPADVTVGRECCTYFTVPTLEEARRRVSMASDEQRIRRQTHWFNPVIAVRSRLGQGMHDRGEAVVFGGGTILDSDRQGLSQHLPSHVKAISVKEKTVRAGEVWDVSVRGEVWGLDDMEELYVVVNVGTLVLERGASIVVRGNVFAFLCQHLIHREHALNADAYQIGILPTPFSVDYAQGPMDGADGADGVCGRDGTDGRILDSENTILGARLREKLDRSVMHGNAGQPGTGATDGVRGRNGGMSKLAELMIRQITGHVTVFTQAGAGGDGGSGGHGGDGGRGGNAGDGLYLARGVVEGGNGGSGGNGGDGGNGGRAGSGGIASNIYINVPTEDEYKITRRSLPSRPGKPGAGGRGGKGGAGGLPGKCPVSEFDGKPGTNGTTGRDGQPGLPGRSRPAPWIFLNEEPADHLLKPVDSPSRQIDAAHSRALQSVSDS